MIFITKLLLMVKRVGWRLIEGIDLIDRDSLPHRERLNISGTLTDGILSPPPQR